MVFTRSIEVNARFSNDRPETLNTCGSGDIMFSVGRLCYRSILLETAVSRQENRQMLQDGGEMYGCIVWCIVWPAGGLNSGRS